MILYIHGEDTFRSRNYLSQTISRFKRERDPQGLNVIFVDGQKEDSSKIWNEILAAPFLAEKRMVIIQNILLNKDADSLASFTEGIKGTNPVFTCSLGEANKFASLSLAAQIKENKTKKKIIVFYQSEPAGKLKQAQELEKLLSKEKWAVKFDKLSGDKLAVWIKSEIKNKGGAINSFAASYLAQNTGGDLWRIDSLLDQSAAYSKGAEISLETVQIFLDEKFDDNIFTMVDAIASGNHRQALKLIGGLRELGEEEGKLFAMILRQFRILIQMRDAYNRQEDLRSDALAKELGLHPYVVKKSLPLVKRYSLARLKEIYDQLFEIDIKTKTGQADQSLLVDLFVAKV